MKPIRIPLLLFFSTVNFCAFADTGATLSASCTGCHGTAGKGTPPMPPLAGLEKSYIVQQMQDFKSGKRPATIMHQLAKGYSDEQIEAMATYFSAQKK